MSVRGRVWGTAGRGRHVELRIQSPRRVVWQSWDILSGLLGECSDDLVFCHALNDLQTVRYRVREKRGGGGGGGGERCMPSYDWRRYMQGLEQTETCLRQGPQGWTEGWAGRNHQQQWGLATAPSS